MHRAFDYHRWLACAFCFLLAGIARAEGDEARPPVWSGSLHLGDDPARYSDDTSGGMSVQVPCKLDAARPGRLTVTARDVQTLLGDGHYVELLAHFAPARPGSEPAREVVVESFRLKDAGGEGDAEYHFQFDPKRGLSGPDPDYYSIRVRIDTSLNYSLWDDFLLKRLAIEQ